MNFTLEIAKSLITIGSTVCVGTVTSQAFKMLAPETAKTATKVAYVVGCTLIGAMVNGKVTEYAVEQFEELTSAFKKHEPIL